MGTWQEGTDKLIAEVVDLDPVAVVEDISELTAEVTEMDLVAFVEVLFD